MKTCVIDIETMPCLPALARASVEPDGGFPPWTLHELVCVSVLSVERDANWLPEFRIETFSRETLGERGIIASLERTLEASFEVVTFNGRGFDIPVLLNRAAVAMEFAPTIAKLQAQGRYVRSVHVDLLEEITNHGAAPRVRLQDLCAGYAIPVKFDCHGSEVAQLAANGEWRRVADYCEADVVATYLALQCWRSAERGDPRMILDNWSALAGWINDSGPQLAHLAPFADMPDWPGGGGPLGGRELEGVA